MEQKSSVISRIIEIYVFCFLSVIIFIVITAFIPSDAPGEANTGSFSASPFNEGWLLEQDGNTIPVTLPVKLNSESGDELIIRNTIPGNVREGMTLMFRTSIEDIFIYIDGTLRESYSSLGFRKMSYHLPSAYVVTSLEGQDAGKEIEVRITVKDKGVLNDVLLSNGNNAWFKIIRENITITVIASIVAILGLATTVIYAFFSMRNTFGKSVLYLGLLMIDTGLWSLSESRLRQIIFARPSMSTYFAYFSMELAGILVCMFLNEVQGRKHNKQYLILESLMTLQMLVNVILGLTGVLELYQSITFSHVWFVLGIVVILYNIALDIIRKQTSDYAFVLTGMGIFILFVILELANFYINPFRSFGVYICTGLLFLLVFTLIQETYRIYKLRLEKSLSDAANKAKSDFLASMSHEIRTPINAVLGMNEMILRESRDPEISEYARNIEIAGTSLMDIINDILDLSKIESGKLEIINTDYDPAFVINDAVTMIENRAKEKGLSLKVHVDRQLPAGLFGDDIRLRQILVNLLTNAVKYTEKGQIMLTVNVIKTEDMKAYLNISVKDTGIGIRPEDCDKLFQSFTRVDEVKNKSIEGTGLGLSIVSRLLDLMGSRLMLESIYGVGSDFYFDLTQEITDATPIGNYEAHTARRISRTKHNQQLYAPGARILVIDDRPMNLAVVKGFLKNSGIVTDGAHSGEEGIQLMKENHYDMIFFDHMMPGLDGIETYRRCIKEGILDKDFPAVMMTANAVSDAGSEYLAAGFCDYIFKPVSSDELIRIIAKHLPEDLMTSRPGAGLVDASQGLDNCMGDESVYRSVIDEFLKEQDDIKLEKAYGASDWDEYRVIVHSIKSSANYIGAKQLHDLAYGCEDALKQNDLKYIEQNHARLLELYRDTVSSVI